MPPLTKTDLKFKKIEHATNAPKFHCNTCGKNVEMNGGYMADYYFDDTGHVSFFVCSDDCLIDFNCHAQVDEYINEVLRKAIAAHKERLDK